MPRNSYFAFKQFRIDQGQCAMKVTTDACLFGALLGQSPCLHRSKRVLDIGAGTGLLSLMAAQNSNATITAVELDEQAAQQALSNFADSPWAEQLQLINCAMQNVATDQRFDCIVTNPPFFQHAFKGTDARRNLARHTDTLTFTDLAHAIAQYLHDDGEAWVLLPVTSTTAFMHAATRQELVLTRQIGLRSSPNHPVHRHILVLGHRRATAEPLNEELLTIYDQHPHYSEQTRQLMAPYYLAL